MAISIKKVLVVEDNEPLRQLIALALAKSGYEVFEAADGIEALERVREAQPDLILMDLAMPRMTGGEAIRLLKQNPSTRHIPVVAETAFEAGEETEQAFKAGAIDVLHKPLSLRFLPQLIQRYASPDRRVAADA